MTLAEVADAVINLHRSILYIDGRITIFVIQTPQSGIVAVEGKSSAKTEDIGRVICIEQLGSALEAYLRLDIDCLRTPTGESAVNADLNWR